jgi:hypothetical protein
MRREIGVILTSIVRYFPTRNYPSSLFELSTLSCPFPDAHKMLVPRDCHLS